MTKATKIKLNLGSGIVLKAGFINVDAYLDEKELRKGAKTKKGPYRNAIVERGAKFVKGDVRQLPFKDNYADYIEFSHTIEHLPMKDVIPCLKEIYRVMKPGAKLVVFTNDTDGVALQWIQMAMNPFDIKEYQNVADVLHGNQAGLGEFHLSPFNASYLNYCLVQAGFKKGELGRVQKFARIPKIGEMVPRNKNSVARNDMLFAEVTK